MPVNRRNVAKSVAPHARFARVDHIAGCHALRRTEKKERRAVMTRSSVRKTRIVEVISPVTGGGRPFAIAAGSPTNQANGKTMSGIGRVYHGTNGATGIAQSQAWRPRFASARAVTFPGFVGNTRAPREPDDPKSAGLMNVCSLSRRPELPTKRPTPSSPAHFRG